MDSFTNGTQAKDQINVALDPYSTHAPILAAVMAIAPPGDVIEFGIGGYSTPLLHGLCALSGRHMVSVESNEQWAKELLSYASNNHSIVIERSPHLSPVITSRKWAVAFVDNGQYERRPCLNIIYDRCGIVVVHDTERPELYEYEPFLTEMFKYRVDLVTRPWRVKTTIVSNAHDISRLKGLWK